MTIPHNQGGNCCSFPKVSLGSAPEMPAESCGEIKASEQGMAVNGRYWLEPQETKMKSKNFLVTYLLFFISEQFKKKNRFVPLKNKNVWNS